MRNRRWAAVGLAAVALFATACGSSGNSNAGGSGATTPATTPASSPTNASTSATMTSAKIGGATVLTDSKGFTVYWFAKDTVGKSNCTGTCAVFWPPVTGPVTAGAGVTGTLGTITRADGTIQATWNGHPLYTYKSDTSPGMNKGNGVTASGGLWHEIVLSGKAAPKPKSTSTGGSGGYGY
jgi:predicted lipoprotein with Yx(FWY)xxD motif